MADPIVYVTLLPCGAAGGALNFTAILTPALDTSADLPSIFRQWPAISNALRGLWTLQIKQGGAVVASGTGTPVSARAEEPLWDAFVAASLQDGKLPVRKRTRADGFKKAWLLSHHAAQLHQRHQEHRVYHATRQLVDNFNPEDKTTLFAGIDEQIDATAPRNVYLFPVIGSDGGAPSAMSKLVADRNIALAFLQANIPAAAPLAAVRQRIDHGQIRLETEQGEQLTGLALMALFHICAESALRQTPGLASNLVNAIDLAAKTISTYSDQLYSEIRRYVGFHLFTKRATGSCVAPPPPDFHQLLGLLNQYPAMLRPLGLAFDFTGVTLTTPAPAGMITASLQWPREMTGASPQSLDTWCTSASDFIAASRPPQPASPPIPAPYRPMHSGRFLNLQLRDNAGNPVYSLVTEDADGSSHKLTQQAAAAARAKEYKATTAPPDNGLGLPIATQSVPSSRTTGIALYYTDRENSLADAVQNTPDASNTTRPPLYIEDLTLGYRVDVRNVNADPSSWMSLHERESKYTIHGHSWEPGGTALPADEGFITLATTQTPVNPPAPAPPDVPADDGQNLQMQVHQALMTWTGWGLSVPLPKNQRDDPMKKPQEQCPGPGLSGLVAGVFTVKPGSLPKLRFGETYAVRLRHVDLAGNSLPLSAAVPAAAVLAMDSAFSRHEPVRAPQILVESPINLVDRPGEHADRMVLRDNPPSTSRILVPPREPLRMAELHGYAESSNRPPSAFPELQLMPKGSFPSVFEASQNGWIHQSFDKKTAENQDAIYLLKRDGVPDKAYYSDPMARFVRIEPLVLQQDLSKYLPWRQDQDVIASKVEGLDSYYLDFQWIRKWPLVSPVRIVVRPVVAEKPMGVHQDWMPEGGKPGTIPVLYVDVPAGWTVALRLTSAACFEPSPPAEHSRFEEIMRVNAPPQGNPIPPALPSGGHVNLFNSFQKLVNAAAPQAALPARMLAGAHGPSDAEADDTDDAGLQAVAANPQFQQRLANVLSSVTAETFVCGTTHYVTPPRILTIVHALRQPLDPPDFSGDVHGSGFQVVRASGDTTARATTKFSAHWQSTAKIACHATWTDTIDDPTKNDLATRPSAEVAFEFLNSGMPEASGKPKASGRNVSAEHQFRDTRAHSVIYSLSAFGRFNEYYPANPARNGYFTRDAKRTCTVDVLSSVRPPAPSIAYIVPAFDWRDAWDANTKTWRRGRTMVLRVYLHRPFLVSGDEECLGVVLGTAGGSARAPVTQWGSDPIVVTDYPLSTNLMAASDFAGGTPNPGCRLSEGGAADILPFPVEFSKDRGLWFCDIPLSASRTPSSFARLALVRWQPKAITPAMNPANDDARLSQVVLADFMQIGPDRWVSVKKVNAKQFSVTVSGVFRTPAADSITHHTISCSVEQRWHRLGSDLGWRPVCPGPPFKYQPPGPHSSVSSWSAPIDLPHSSSAVKFRLLLEEHEWLAADASKANTPGGPPIRKARTTYLHYIEL